MRFIDFRLKTKLAILASVGVVGMMAVGVTSTVNLNSSNDKLKVLNQGIHTVAAFADMRARLLTARLDVVYMMSLKEDAKLAEKHADMKDQIAKISEAVRVAENSALSSKEREWLGRFKSGAEAYVAQGGRLAEMLLAAHRSGDAAALSQAISFGVGQVAPLYRQPAEAIEELEKFNLKQSEEAFATANALARRAVLFNVALVAAICLASAAIAVGIGRCIGRGLENVMGVMSLIADGDLTADARVASRDEMGTLGKEMNRMRERLSGIVRRLADNGLSVSSAAIQMHSTAEQMATSTEELAAQAATIATACEEMSTTSADIARNCHRAADDSSRANSAAVAGTRVVDSTVLIMGRIAEKVRVSAQTVERLGGRSNQIGAIIETIEDIADQTNLLALNAAIEAARAGELGRGFAVVADEVRALAERTTKATHEIGAMIKSIQAETQSAVSAMDEGVLEVEQGTSEAAKSGDALRHILELISNVTDQVNQIAIAAEEQTATTMEINHNIQQVTDVANPTATSSHEEAAAANQLARLAEDLKGMVEQFRYA